MKDEIQGKINGKSKILEHEDGFEYDSAYTTPERKTNKNNFEAIATTSKSGDFDKQDCVTTPRLIQEIYDFLFEMNDEDSDNAELDKKWVIMIFSNYILSMCAPYTDNTIMFYIK